jgi:hypothetical protein
MEESIHVSRSGRTIISLVSRASALSGTSAM